ncbi:MAG: putative C-S lyase [Bacteroidales bacterium]|nr:putative C-S lyase [Bacteroidales bacterium]
MEFNFDKIIDRSRWYAKKYIKMNDTFGRDDIIPLWIADMDFESPKCVQEELHRISDFDAYGYFCEPAEYRDSIIDWYKTEYGWTLEREWINFVPGLIHALAHAVYALTKEGDKILVQKPVYNSFFDLPLANGRQIVDAPLTEIEEPVEKGAAHYRMNLELLEKVLCENEAGGAPVKLMILCNPQNPIGVNWTREELTGLAKCCHAHDVTVISDESFCDLQLWGNRHIPFATVCPEAAQICVTFATPTKTFNLSGLVTSFAIISNPELRERYFHFLDINEFNYPVFFSMMPSIAAFRKGKPWLEALLKYIEGNVEYFEKMCEDFTDENGIPYILPQRPQNSYLVWTDCRHLLCRLTGKSRGELEAKDQDVLVDYFVNRVGIGLKNGLAYGPQCVGFMRTNLAVSRSVLKTIKFLEP